MNVGKWLDGCKCNDNFEIWSSQDLIIIAEGYDWIVCKGANSSTPLFNYFSDEDEKNELIKEWELENE